jgi:hypothetical protein
VWSAQDGAIAAVLETDARRVTQLLSLPEAEGEGDLAGVFARHAEGAVSVSQDGKTCARLLTEVEAAAPESVRVLMRFSCPQDLLAHPAQASIRLFAAVSATHVHYARADIGAGAEAALAGPGMFALGASEQGPAGAFGFLRSGAEHVLFGLDHLAFLLALALFAGSPGRVAWAATGFTLGHSLTLGLVAYEIVRPVSAAVEALIGFTIAYAAAEALKAREGPAAGLWVSAVVVAIAVLSSVLGATLEWPVYVGLAVFAAACAFLPTARLTGAAPILAGVFGLAHGAGFAGGLAALDLPTDRLLPALLAFNIGVELGQIAALLAFWGLAALAGRILASSQTSRFKPFLAAGLVALGAYWFSVRSFLA